MTPALTDTSNNVSFVDPTTTGKPAMAKASNDSYRFVIEMAGKKRAYYRVLYAEKKEMFLSRCPQQIQLLSNYILYCLQLRLTRRGLPIRLPPVILL